MLVEVDEDDDEEGDEDFEEEDALEGGAVVQGEEGVGELGELGGDLGLVVAVEDLGGHLVGLVGWVGLLLSDGEG